MEGLRITPASFTDAQALQRAIANAMKGSNIELPENMKSEIKLGGFIDAAMSLISSPEVDAALFKCAEKAVYNNQKVSRDFFEDVANRELYYEIMLELIKVNVGPFFKRIASKFAGLEAIKSALPK